MPLGPLDLTAGPFLKLYAVLFVLALAVSLAVPAWLGQPRRDRQGVQQALQDSALLAYLGGGAVRLAESVMARLLAAGVVEVDGQQFRHTRRDTESFAGDGAAQAVLELHSPFRWSDIEYALHDQAQAAAQTLVRAGLLLDVLRQARQGLYQALPLLLLVAFGMLKCLLGLARDKPVGWLLLAMAVTAVVALLRWRSVDARTAEGKAVYALARRRSERLRRAPAADEADLAVALFGTVVLTGSGLWALHQLRHPPDSGAGAAGAAGTDAGADGGSGCGGGCGGCGGGGD
ncbi:TIGR04222 domain-containing membrane protein [Corticibacter populi]|uniref:TIGR04222 domain-containing membrane protein n=1 Tax=Corticibacter populi TaxID=1550736 RepID=UPI0010ECFEF5|nr:TIGR04222 domain-containing membrane protein [Corticibacter populi]RZS33774.1 uncharacterized protein (TIGR04222 family) [Corticibacter populi]